MANHPLRFSAAFFAVHLIYPCVSRLPAEAADGPNRATPSDVAAGRWVDSLLDPNRATGAPPRTGPTRPSRRVAQRRTGLRGKLVKNPKLDDGAPPFALVDRYGGILRYIEPVDSVDLQAHLGQAVAVKHDTGDILLASQLALPRKGRPQVRPESRATSRAGGELELVQNLEPIPAGEPVPAGEPYPAAETIGESSIAIGGHENGPLYLDGGYDEGLDFGGCPSCGSYVCPQLGGCGPGSRGRAYVRGEYLLWWFEGMDTPPLVTQSDLIDGGVLPNPGYGDNTSTVILFGGDGLLDDSRSGARVLFGTWIDDAGRQGIEADYFGFDTETQQFSAEGQDGAPTISRPFFELFAGYNNTGTIDNPPAEAAEQVSSATLDGRVTVRLESDFDSFGIRFRHNLCCCGSCATGCGDGVACGGGVGCGSGVGYGGGTRRVDLLTGFRYSRLQESLNIREDLTVRADGTQFLVQDLFKTENEFTGGEVGFLWEIEHRRWTLELLSKLAIGNTRQRVRIDGSTSVTVNPPPPTAPDAGVGGLLALSSNIGSYERDQFSVMPELGLTLGYRLTPRLRVTAGYTLLYWTNVLRPGDQIDRELNSTLLPDFDANGAPVPPGALAGPLRPLFQFQNTDLWANGINLGGEYRW